MNFLWLWNRQGWFGADMDCPQAVDVACVRRPCKRRQETQSWYLVNYADVLGRPINKSSFSINEISFDRSEFPAVRRNGTVITHDKELILGDYDGVDGSSVSKLLRNIRLIQQLAIDINIAMVDAEPISGNGDYSLDIAFLLIARVTENHDVARLDGCEVVDEFIDEEAILIDQAREHAGALDANGLIEEGNDQY